MKTIKKNIFLFLFLSFFAFSCGNSTELLYNDSDLTDGTMSRIPRDLINIKLYNVRISDLIQQGSNVNFDLYIENDSGARVNNYIYVTAYLKAINSESEKWLYSWKFEGISENTTVVKNLELTVPFNTEANEEGYQFVFKADETDFLSESNEYDNISVSNDFLVSTATLKPDLWPKINNIDSNTRKVNLSIFNLSSMKLGKEIFYYQVWLSKDDVLDNSDTLVFISDNYQNNDFVEIGFLESFNESFVIPESYIDKEVAYHLFVSVDTTFFIPEDDEGNNIVSKPIIFY